MDCEIIEQVVIVVIMMIAVPLLMFLRRVLLRRMLTKEVNVKLKMIMPQVRASFSKNQRHQHLNVLKSAADRKPCTCFLTSACPFSLSF